MQAMDARIPGVSARSSVAVERIVDAELLADGDLTVQLPSVPIVPRGRLQVVVISETGERTWAMIKVARFDSVATLIASVSSGEPVANADFQFFWIETTRFSGDPITPSILAAMDDGDLVANRSLRADRPLRRSDIGPRPAAEAGDSIIMTHRRSAFVFTVTCKSRDRGKIGDVIRLYDDDTDTMYRARLTARGRAEWLETL